MIDRGGKLRYTVAMQKNFEELTIKEYNELLGSRAPAPGGGSALCQVAVVACSLIEMAVNITVAKLDPGDENCVYLLSQREFVLRAKRGLCKLSNDDARAFGRIAEGLKLPKATDEQRASRHSELQKAYHKAALVPLDVMALCRELVKIATVRIAPLLSKYVASDCTIAIDLLRTVARNSMHNVTANANLIEDGTLAANLTRQGAQILAEL